MNELLNFEIFSNEELVAKVTAFSSRGHDVYDFSYVPSWIEKGYSLDPTLYFTSDIQHVQVLPPCLQDICPDRWGRLIQKRKLGYTPSSTEYLLGVSDYFRMGALRIKINGKFVDDSTDRPKLTSLNELIEASRQVELGNTSDHDIKLLFAPSGSLGGARPKGCVVDKGQLFLAKFPSINDQDIQLSKCEKVYLDLAKEAGIKACSSKVIESKFGDVLLLPRFDRNTNNTRIPFMSAMTALGLSENDELDNYSYVDLAMSDFMTSKEQKQELFRRMLFNGLFGNTDDHLRNHGFLRINGEWQLSPAYDLTPNTVPYNKQHHALCFIEGKDLPSLALFNDIKDYFEVDDKLFKSMLLDMKNAQASCLSLLKKNKVSQDNIKLLENNFEHKDFEKLKNFD